MKSPLRYCSLCVECGCEHPTDCSVSGTKDKPHDCSDAEWVRFEDYQQALQEAQKHSLHSSSCSSCKLFLEREGWVSGEQHAQKLHEAFMDGRACAGEEMQEHGWVSREQHKKEIQKAYEQGKLDLTGELVLKGWVSPEQHKKENRGKHKMSVPRPLSKVDVFDSEWVSTNNIQYKHLIGKPFPMSWVELGALENARKWLCQEVSQLYDFPDDSQNVIRLINQAFVGLTSQEWEEKKP